MYVLSTIKMRHGLVVLHARGNLVSMSSSPLLLFLRISPPSPLADRIVVNSTLGGVSTATVWDSGVVASNVSTHVVYGGQALVSDTQYSWAVQWTDLSGATAAWSAPSFFSTGLLTQAEWSLSDFITCPQPGPNAYNQLRTEFSLGLPAGVTVAQARLYITAIGYYRAFFNGARLGLNELDPAWTNYPQRLLYNSYDVTSAMSATGGNALAVYVGNGCVRVGGGEADLDTAP